MPGLQIRRAVKGQGKARIAFSGPSGAGKTMWALSWARKFAGGGRVVVIDTERDSSELYADMFSFDIISLGPPYHPDRLVEAIALCEEAGAAAVVGDSLSHFWIGRGGVLEIVDRAAERFGGNKHMAWAVGTPLQQRMVDAFLGMDAHFIATMRSKTEWGSVQEEGKKPKPVKIGMTPQQRDGLEYEFTLTGELEVPSNVLTIGKSRAAGWVGRYFDRDQCDDAAQEFLTWLSTGDPIITPEEAASIDALLAPVKDRRALSVAWRDAGLPKVRLLTLTQASQARALLAQMETLDEADVLGSPAPAQSTQDAPTPPPAAPAMQNGSEGSAGKPEANGETRPALVDTSGYPIDPETGEISYPPGEEPF